MLVLAVLLCGLAVTPARASHGSLVETLSTDNFTIHFTGDTDTDHATMRQWVGELGANLEWARDTYVNQWGYPAPANVGPIDVYILDLESEYGEDWAGVLGVAILDAPGNQAPVHFEIHPAAIRDPQIAAHEMFHAIQAAMYTGAPSWLYEATAEWAAYRLLDYPGSSSPFHEPDNSLDCQAVGFGIPCGLSGYESGGYSKWTFFQYLHERYGANVVKELWQQVQAVSSSAYDGDDAIRDVLAGKGASLTDVFGDYTVAMLTGSFQTPLLAGKAPVVHATGLTGSENGSLAPLRVAVNRLAVRFVQLRAPSPDTSLCYAATLTLTVTLPAGVTSRPHVFATGTRTLTALSVNGTTATASIPWDTCSSEAPAYVSLPNTSQTLDGRMFVVNASVTVDKTKIVSPKTPPPGAAVIGAVVAAPTEDPAPELSFYARNVMRLAADSRVLRLVFFSSGTGRVRVAFNGQQVVLLKVRAGANAASVRLPKPARRFSASSRAVLELTALSPAGAPGSTFVQRVAFTKPKTKRSGR
jgi:hypothetical protein